MAKSPLAKLFYEKCDKYFQKTFGDNAAEVCSYNVVFTMFLSTDVTALITSKIYFLSYSYYFDLYVIFQNPITHL